MNEKNGIITQVIGPVVDVVFTSNAEHQAQLPAINEALTVKRPDGRDLIIEVQQSSDLTYRVYDFNRRDAQGNLRQLHTAEAREALNFKSRADYRTHYEDRENCRVQLESCPQFTTSVYHLTQPLRADYADVDSFAILICYEGQAELTDSEGNTTTLKAGETVLFPATNKWVDIRPLGEGRFSCVETYTLG